MWTGFGRRLGVAYVVDGSVQRGLGRLRVTLRLVRTSDAVALWAGTYDFGGQGPDHRGAADG